MKIIRFKDFKIIKSKFDQREYLRMVFDGFDGSQRFLAFHVDRKTQLVGGEDILSLDLRDYIRAQCMLNEAKQEVEYGTASSTPDQSKATD